MIEICIYLYSTGCGMYVNDTVNFTFRHILFVCLKYHYRSERYLSKATNIIWWSSLHFTKRFFIARKAYLFWLCFLVTQIWMTSIIVKVNNNQYKKHPNDFVLNLRNVSFITGTSFLCGTKRHCENSDLVAAYHP